MKALMALLPAVLAGCTAKPCTRENTDGCSTAQIYKMIDEVNRESIQHLNDTAASHARAAKDFEQAAKDFQKAAEAYESSR